MPYLTRTDSLNKHRKGTQGREQKAIQEWKQQLSSPCPLVNPKRTQGQTDPSKFILQSVVQDRMPDSHCSEHEGRSGVGGAV
mmetsp:Transcript_39119/g.123344  ORF Transcript_39119/g.123344 Transcript_39119/m.123344 type:complete len:82 (-) Transcript_39119:158-403(-)